MPGIKGEGYGDWRYARDERKPVVICYPDGGVKYERMEMAG